MEEYIELIMAVVIVLTCAIAVLLVGKRLRIPFIIGYFITGVIVGPFGLHLITEEQVSLLAELGVILLMFTIGLEIPLKNLLSMKKIVLIGGGLQLILTTGVVWLVMVAAGFSSSVSLFIGFLVAHSSTAIIMNIYQKSGEIDTQHGKIALGLLIFQDLNVVPMMMLVPLLAGSSETDLAGSVLNFFIGMGLLAVILIASIYLVPKFLERVTLTRSSELFVMAVVLICLGIAWVMSLTGVSIALGAFLAGVAISGSDYSHEVIGQIMPIRDLLTSFFFVSIGMMLNLTYLSEHLLLIAGVSVLLLLGKTLINIVSVKVIGISAGAAILSAIGLSQVGEFSFILGSTGLATGLLTQNMYQIFLAMSIVTMAITPFYVAAGPWIAGKITSRLPEKHRDFDEFCIPGETDLESHVIIVGYGLGGRYVARALKKMGIPYIILEMNAETVAKERKRGENIVYGDASRECNLEFAGIDKAQTIVISIPIMEAIKAIVTTARRMNPKISIITRSRYISETNELYRLGADEVIVDEKEAALQIFRRILANQQIPVQELEMYSQQVRSEVYNEYLDGTGGGRPPVSEQKNGGGVLDAIRLKAKHADEVISTSKTYVEQIRVGKDCDCAGKRLCDLHLRMNFGVSVIAVRRAGRQDAIVSPDGDTVLEEGDTVVVIGNRDDIATMTMLFTEKDGEEK